MPLAEDETTIDFIVVGIVAIVIGYIVYQVVENFGSDSGTNPVWAWLGGVAAGGWAYALLLT